ncbi:hypothetical protein [Desulfotalea psychrophila]|uniref:hypothetical protein n=1 Tax=Desulfotalea psychrophila TaxID=84980 RepID=UPI0002EA986C|nr:hypothetical protein [Desulfotalea psychrophila]
MTNIIEYLQKNGRLVRMLIFLATAILLLWSFFGVDSHHAHTWAEKHIPFFWSIFALLSTVVLIFFAGWFSKGIQQEKEYYDD